MNRIQEIQARLAEINAALENATGETLTALETESRNLCAELERLVAEQQARQQLRSSIAAGLVPHTVIDPASEEPSSVNRFAIDSAEYREAYLMGLQGRELTAEQRAAVSASAAIPTQTMDSILRYVEDSPILSHIDMTYIPGNVTIPVEDSVADASWVAMANAATDSADAIDSITLGAYKLIKTLSITADVQAMAIDAFEAWLVAKLGEKMQKALDAAVFTGTGNNQPTGILTAISAASGTFTKAKATYADLIKIIAALPSGPAKNAVFAMPRTLFFTDVLGIEDTNKKPICHIDLESPAKYNILGYKVILDDNITADNILFGDFKAYKMNIAKAPVISSDDSVEFRTGNRVYRAMALADGKLALSDAFVRFTRATS